MCRSTLNDAIQLVLVFVLLPPESQQMQDLLLRRAALLQLLQTLAVDLPPRQVLQQPLQRHGGEAQRGERLVDGLLAQSHVWRRTDRQTGRVISGIRSFALDINRKEKEKKALAVLLPTTLSVPHANAGHS